MKKSLFLGVIFIAVRINVENSVKGQNGDVMVVQTSQSSASCGYNFEEGEKYIVYSDNGGEEDGELNVSLCSRTALVKNAQEVKGTHFSRVE